MPQTDVYASSFYMNVGQSVLAAVKDTLSCKGLDVPGRAFVGFDRPPQDCCPELVVWVGNVSTETNLDAGLKGGWGFTFDVTVRIGRCYVDYTNEGPLDIETVQDWTLALYQDAEAIYNEFLADWSAGNVDELTKCDLITIGPLSQYHEGGCAGHEFTVTVQAL